MKKVKADWCCCVVWGTMPANLTWGMDVCAFLQALHSCNRDWSQSKLL